MIRKNSLLFTAVTDKHEFGSRERIHHINDTGPLPITRRFKQSVHQVPSSIVFKLSQA
jgi:hypothetical protein